MRSYDKNHKKVLIYDQSSTAVRFKFTANPLPLDLFERNIPCFFDGSVFSCVVCSL